MGDDLSIVNAARVSFAKESEWDWQETYCGDCECIDDDKPGCTTQILKQSDQKLISYLAKHKHFSPFNHTFLSFRVKAPIFVARQLVKHEYMPWNEVSRRYVDSEPEFWLPEVVRAKGDNVKQGSSEEAVTGAEDVIRDHTESCLRTYQMLKGRGVCPEQARIILPHNLMTEWIWSGTLKAFHKMLELRLDPHTQVETRIVANLIKPQIEERFPVSLAALLNNK